MTRRVDTPPDLARRDAGMVLFGHWRTEPGREGEVADGVASAWDALGLPTFGVRSFSVFLGEGDVLLVNQLSRPDTRPDVELEAAFITEVRARAPRFDILEVSAARPYRSAGLHRGESAPGRYTRASITLADPSPTNQHQWVDAVLTASPAPSPESGLIATHFYLTMDTTRVLALAEWTTAEAQPRLTDRTDPTDVPGAPEVTTISTDQYRFAFSLLPEMADRR